MTDTIRTERLTLRPPVLSDAPALAQQFGDWKVARMTGTIPHPYVPMAADFWILVTRAKQRRGLARSYMIETRNGEIVGNISLFRAGPGDEWEVGYHLGVPFWGRGYGREALGGLLDDMRRRGETKVVAGVYDDNPASQRLLERFGFKPTRADQIFCMARQERVPGRRYQLDLTRTGARAKAVALDRLDA